LRLVQLRCGAERRLAVVEEPLLRLVDGYTSVYQFALACIAKGREAEWEIAERLSERTLEYDAVYAGRSEWNLLPAADHPEEPTRCLVSGTGLTHMASAKNRDAMHARESELTDSMRMYRWGVEGGKPESGTVGAAPEWFYKGTGASLRAHGEPLVIPGFSSDGGEEPEIAAVYVIDPDGRPWRIGFANGNEFSDHEFERRNYLNLAASKLRTCAMGPELVLGTDFQLLPGEVAIERGGRVLWSKAIRSGESVMSHSLENLEHHHFKFEAHRRPGDVHVHFLGADAFSFGEGIRLQAGDIMQVRFDGLGRALRNRLERCPPRDELVRVEALN
jgi:hypothetical protein